MGMSQQRRGRSGEPPRPHVEFVVTPGSRSGNALLASASITAFAGTRPLDGWLAEFRVDGVSYGNVALDNTGAATCALRVPAIAAAHTVIVVATVTSPDGSVVVTRTRTLDVPAAPGTPTPRPARLRTEPRRVENRVDIYISVVDTEGRAIERAEITLADSVNPGVLVRRPLDHGETVVGIDLTPDHPEREIIIALTGHPGEIRRLTLRFREDGNGSRRAMQVARIARTAAIVCLAAMTLFVGIQILLGPGEGLGHAALRALAEDTNASTGVRWAQESLGNQAAPASGSWWPSNVALWCLGGLIVATITALCALVVAHGRGLVDRAMEAMDERSSVLELQPHREERGERTAPRTERAPTTTPAETGWKAWVKRAFHFLKIWIPVEAGSEAVEQIVRRMFRRR